jgi:Methyltransferase domain
MQREQSRRAEQAVKSIHGWFEAAGLFALIDEVQHETGVTGDLFEIGAHHGKSAVVLGHMAMRGETVGICDIFGGQDANASGSGYGDRAIFEANMREHAPAVNLRVFDCLSSALTGENVGTCRFFHVDGGHLAEEALGDIRLAAETTSPGGAIVVDDPFRIEWPGVTEAILAFLHDRTDWTTAAIGMNKLVLVQRTHVAGYRQALTGDRAWQFISRRVYARKSLPVAGEDAAIFYIPTYRQIPGLPQRVATGRHAWGAVRRRLGR